MDKFLPDLEALGNGRPLSEALEREVRIINQAPLDEFAGERCQCSTNHEHQRAPASASQNLKRNTRLPQNLALVKQFVKLGPRGKAVVRSEWKNWKRVVQTQKKKLHKNVRLRASARICRQDCRAFLTIRASSVSVCPRTLRLRIRLSASQRLQRESICQQRWSR